MMNDLRQWWHVWWSGIRFGQLNKHRPLKIGNGWVIRRCMDCAWRIGPPGRDPFESIVDGTAPRVERTEPDQ